MSSERIDVSGKRFGRVAVIGLSGIDHGHVMWKCRCDCGKEFDARGSSLASGNTKSCGCLQSETVSKMMTVHGQAKRGNLTGAFTSFKNAKRRCNDPNFKNFNNYGGRGIRFKFKSFIEFFKELGQRPKGKTLDRIDNDGHYEPGNVRWATRREQNLNTRNQCK